MYIPVTKPPPIKPEETEKRVQPFQEFSQSDIKDPQDISKNSDIDTFEGTKLQKVLRESVTHSELLESDKENITDSESSLLIPVSILTVIVFITLFLALFRLFYTRFYKDKEELHSR